MVGTWARRWTLVSAALVLVPVVAIKTLGEIAPLAAFGMLASIAMLAALVGDLVLLPNLLRIFDRTASREQPPAA